jgi:hypothetical protein
MASSSAQQSKFITNSVASESLMQSPGWMGIRTAARRMKFSPFNEINYRLLCDANKSAFSMHKRKRATMLSRVVKGE